MLQENAGNGAWSSTRFAFIFSVVISNVAIFSIFIYESIKNNQIADVPEGVLWIYALANGISFAGKVSQKFKEVKEEKNDKEVKRGVTEV